MCQACTVHKKKCLNMLISAWKLKWVVSMAEGSLHETSEGLQGWEWVDTLWASTSVMQRLLVLEVVEMRSTQCLMPWQKCVPAMETEGEPLDSGSLTKRQRECSLVHVSTPIEGSSEIEPPTMDWEALVGDKDVEMGMAVEVTSQELRGKSPQGWRGVEAWANLQGCLMTVGMELKHLEQALFDEYELSYREKVRPDTECRWVEEEQVCVSEVMCSIMHVVICLQQTVRQLQSKRWKCGSSEGVGKGAWTLQV